MIIEEYEYEKECSNCGGKMPDLIFVPPKLRPISKLFFILSIPLMIIWAVLYYFFSPFVVFGGGGIIGALLTAFIYLGPGLVLALLAAYFTRVHYAECEDCKQIVQIRGKNLFGKKI